MSASHNRKCSGLGSYCQGLPYDVAKAGPCDIPRSAGCLSTDATLSRAMARIRTCWGGRTPYQSGPTCQRSMLHRPVPHRTHVHTFRYTHTAQTNVIYATRLSVKRLQWQVNHASQTVVLHLPTGFAHSPVATHVFESTGTKLMNHIAFTSTVSSERCNICGSSITMYRCANPPY